MSTQILKSARTHIVCIGLLLGIAFTCSSAYIAYHDLGQTKKQRLTHLKQITQVARNTIEPILIRYRSQKISKENAIEQVRDLVRRMVYTGYTGKNYIFMSSYDGTMLVQPFDPEKEMSNMWNLKDSNGFYIIRALTKAAESKEKQGYVSYHYQRPSGTTPQEKISFVTGIPELQCYIGTGQYIDDINKSQSLFIVKLAGLTFGLLFLLFLLIWSSIKGLREQNKMLLNTNSKLYGAQRELTVMFDSSFHFIGSLSPEGVLKKANRTSLEAIHADEADVVGKPFWETPWWQKEETIERLKKAISECSKGKCCRFEASHKTWDMESLYVDFNLSPVFDEKGSVVSLLAEGQDVTEQVKVRNDLIREQTFFDYIIKSFPGLFFLYKLEDGQYRFKKWNEEQHKQILGFPPEDMMNTEMSTMISEKDHPLLKNAVEQSHEKGSVYVQLDTKTKEGGAIPVLYLGTHFTHAGDDYIVGTGIELTEKLKAEEEKKKLESLLFQSQKMEAMGSLAGGIAHDFNNILSAIMGYAEMVEERLSPDTPEKAMQGQVMKAALRAKDLVQQILLFSRQTEVAMQPTHMNMVIKEAIKLLRSSIPTTIEIKHKIQDKAGVILADATQLHQIVMNLCTNAYHSMRETGGILSVSLSEREISKEDSIYSDLSLAPGNYMVLDVSDTGHGMDQNTIDKIFNPYFTTKKQGEGTGLGLAVVHGIVRACGGEIRVYSEIGQGTSFHVYFPKIEDKAQSEQSRNRVALQRGNERVLVVDDDKVNADMMKSSLENLGYQVTVFTASQEALDAFNATPDNFDLVVTDMTMPKINGVELSKKILIVRPQMPIVLCTGYSELISKEKVKSIGIKAFLLKPVLREELARTMREALDGHR